MPVENVGAVQPPAAFATDNRTEAAANETQQTQASQQTQAPQQPRTERAPLPEASGWNVDLFA